MHNLYNLTPGAHEIDDNGFLRVPLRVLAVGIMSYTVDELGDSVPPELRGESIIKLLVSPEAISDPRAIRSLEGMPLTAGEHDWQDPTSNATQVGNIAGTPRVEGPYLLADGLVTDDKAAQKIINRQLPEISAAYDMDISWGVGEYGGESYHGTQTKLRYNHTTLLPAGKGRGGQEVRVLNTDSTTTTEESAMSGTQTTAFTLVNLPGSRSVRVLNEDAQAVSEAVENAAEEAKQTTATAFNEQVEGIANQLKVANEEMAASEAKVAELKGQIEQMQEQLVTAMDPAVIDERAEEMQNDREEAAKVMNCATLPDDLKSLTGHALRSKAIERVRAANSLPALSAEQMADESGINGRWAIMVENAAVQAPRNKVPGAEVTQPRARATNSTGSASRDRINHLYGAKAKA